MQKRRIFKFLFIKKKLTLQWQPSNNDIGIDLIDNGHSLYFSPVSPATNWGNLYNNIYMDNFVKIIIL